MVTGAFLDRSAPPTADAILAALLPPARARWVAIATWLADTYGLEPENLWAGPDTGWVSRYRRSGSALTTLMPQADGSFRALVVVGPSAWPAVPSLPLSHATRAAWDAAKPYPDGRWLWLAVDDDAMADDVRALVACKSPPPRRPRRRTGGSGTAASAADPTREPD